MTLRLGGSGRTSLWAIASLTLAATLACGVAMTGCGDDSSGPAPTVDSGQDSSPAEGGMMMMADGGGKDSTTAQLAPPTFMPASGAMNPAPVTIAEAWPMGVTGQIYYTTDGTVPIAGGGGTTHLYTAPVPVTQPGTDTIIAIAAAPGYSTSNAASASYTVTVDAGPALMPCGAPTFTPNGGSITLGSTVTITPPTGFPMNFPAGNAFVYYTTDGTVPSHSGMSMAYSGPVQINTQPTESIRAIAYYPGVCTDSTVALATFTPTQPEGGALAPPAFNPTAKTGNNDFLVSLTEASTPSATICFTIGSGMTAPMPTCTVTATAATCSGTSQTYNAGAALGATGSVTINGTVTDATGNVTVSAIACAPGNATTAPVPQQYKLQVANPTMQGPAPSESALPWITPATAGAAPYNPTLASATTGATLRYNSYTTGTAPSLDCTTGTLLANLLAQPINPGPLPVAQNITYQGVGCKAGYAPSALESFGYQVVLVAPMFVDSTTASVVEGTGTYDRALSVNVAGCGGTAICTGPTGGYPTGAWWGCYTTNASAPGCGATANTCAAGSTAATAPVAITATGTVVNAIACATNLNASPASTATYTLQLDPPGLDGPGCANTSGTPGTCVASGAGAPLTSYSIPASMVSNFMPNIEESLGSPPPSGGMQPEYQFACAIKGGTPSCTATGCAAGTIVPGTTFETANSVSLGSVVAPGDSWSIIGCPGTATASVGFAPSAVTTVVFGAPGAGVAPSISPATGTYNNLVTPILANQGTVAETVCYTLDGTTPTCAAGVCTAGATKALGISTSTVTSVAVTAGGSGYTSAPTVTIATPSGTGAQQAAATATLGFGVASITLATGGTACGPVPVVSIAAPGSGTTATATATVDSTGTITGFTVTKAGSGYTAAPAVTITGCTAATATAALAAAGSVISVTVTAAGAGYVAVPAVSFSGGGGAAAKASITVVVAGVPPIATLPSIQDDGTTLTAIGCTAGAASSPPVSTTYHFTIATPTVIDSTQSTATSTVSVVNGSTLPIGDSLMIGMPSNFTASTLNICYTADGTTPACGATATTCATGLSAPVTLQTTGPFAGGYATSAIVTTIATFAAGTSTLKAIACDAAADEVASGVYSAALTLTAQTPIATLHGTSTVAATGTYFSAPSLDLTSTPGITAICYTTDGATPQCTAGACTGGSSTFGAPIVINQTGAVLKAVACSATLTSAVSAGNTYTLNVAPIILTQAAPVTAPSNPANPDLTCLTTPSITIGFDCASSAAPAACSTATKLGLGPTATAGGSNAQICYSTNGTAVTSCNAVAGSITCFSTGAAGTGTQTITLNATTTIHALGCLTATGVAFNNSSASLPVTYTPYTDVVVDSAITLDGALTDWTNADERVADSSGTGHGYFTYSGGAGTLYFAVNGGYTSGGTATNYIGVYIGNGVATGAATAGLANLGAPVLQAAAGILYAFEWPTNNASAPVAWAWSAGTGWSTAPGITVSLGVPSTLTNVVEFSVPLSSLPNLGSLATNPVTVIGSEVSGFGTTPTTDFTFPGGGAAYADWFDDNLNSCLTPIAQIH